MAVCREFEPLLEASVEGSLGSADEARLGLHLESCAPCREDLASTRALLEAVRLPPVGGLEAGLLHALPGRVAAALGQHQRERRWQRRAAAVVAVAAMLAVVVVGSARRVRGRLEASSPPSPAVEVASRLGAGAGDSLDESDAEGDSAMADVVAFEDVDTGLSMESR